MNDYLYQNFFYMKKLIWAAIILIAGFAVWKFAFDKGSKGPKPPKQAPIALKVNSDEFNSKLNAAIDEYLNMKDAFIESDVANSKKYAASFAVLLDSIPYNELKNDSALIEEGVKTIASDLKANALKIVDAKDLNEMRLLLSTITELMYPGFLKMTNYEGKPLYVQHCPMAFEDEIAANWLSYDSKIMNPYLGKDHPVYKAGMLHCGEILDSIAK